MVLPFCLLYILAKLECGLHTLIHTFAFEKKPQYLGLDQENAEFLAPIFSSQHFVPQKIGTKCELRDVIHSYSMIQVIVSF